MSNYLLKMDYPAAWCGQMWREAIPAGNGKLGALVYGGVRKETIMLSHSHLWWNDITLELPDVSDCLPVVRKLLLDKKPFEADMIIYNRLKELGYNPTIAAPLPASDLVIETETITAFKNYQRTLDMESGEVVVSWKDSDRCYKRKLFVSRPDDLVAYNIKEDNCKPFSGEIRLEYHNIADVPTDVKNIQEYLPSITENEICNGFVTFYCEKTNGESYGTVAKIKSVGGKVYVKDSFVSNGSFPTSFKTLVFEDVTELNVLAKVFVGDLEQGKSIIENFSNVNDDYKSLLAKNRAVHGKLFTATTLNLFPETQNTSNELLLLDAYKNEMSLEMLEKMWAFGRYLLISSSKENGLPCHLYGLWCGSYKGQWAFNMANENLQMIYWQALSGNMPDLLMAVFDYLDTMMDDFRENAKKIYGCRGIYIPAPSMPESGLLKVCPPHIIHFTATAGWIASHYYDYFLYTKDEKFLKERALPFMQEVALFYQDFLIEDECGRLMSIPSNSPENSPGNFWDGKEGMGSTMETTINSTIDIAIIKELLTNLISGSRLCGVFDNEIAVWTEMLSKLPEYEINEDGAIKEWIHPYYKDNYRHRHQSHIYPLFPGNEIHKETHPELYDAFVTAINKRLVIGLNQQSGWSLAHMANNYARMREGDLAFEVLDHLARSNVLNNFFTVHNDWRNMGIGVETPLGAPVQVDANMGISAAINEMLLQSYDDNILILPALPSKYKKGEVVNLLARGNITVTISWDKQQCEGEFILTAKHQDEIINIILPDEIDVVSGFTVKENKIASVTLSKNISKKFNFKFR